MNYAVNQAKKKSEVLAALEIASRRASGAASENAPLRSLLRSEMKKRQVYTAIYGLAPAYPMAWAIEHIASTGNQPGQPISKVEGAVWLLNCMISIKVASEHYSKTRKLKREIEAENMLQEAIRSYPGTGVRIIGGESAAK